MTHRDAAFRTTLSALAVTAALMAGMGQAQAQSQAQEPSFTGRANAPVVGNGPKSRTPNPAPPSALPGAQVNRDRVIPAEHSTSDMSPTDALFDAINRGDVQAAQDAINRGADFNGRNILGLTPLDESIDLGRNNITFLLLSLRGGPDSAAPAGIGVKPSKPATPAVAARPTPSPNPPVADRATVATPAAERPTPQNSAASAPAPAPSPGNGGTPNPKSGFLGFGG